MPMPKLVLLVFAALAALCAALYALTVVFEQEARGRTRVPADVRQVVVRTDSGTVRVRAGAAGAPVDVRRRARWLFGRPVLERSSAAGVLTIAASCAGTVGPCAPDLDVVVPADVDVTAVSEAGDVRARGLGGRVGLHTEVGDVRGEDLAAVITRATAEAGDVVLRFADAPPQVVAITQSGDVELVVPADDEYRIDAVHPRGRLVVDGVFRNDLAARRIVAETPSGNVRVTGR